MVASVASSRAAGSAVADDARRGTTCATCRRAAARRRAAISSGSDASSSRLCSSVLPKPMPGSAISASARDAGGARRVEPARRGTSPTSRDDVVVVRVALHRARARPACASRRSRRRPRRRRRACRGRRAGGDVVDDRRAGLERGARRRPPSGVDADGHRAVGGERLDDGEHPAQLLVGSSTGSAPGRVDSPPTSSSVGTRRDQLAAVRDGRVGIEEAAAVGEGVGGDVHDTHDRPRGQIDHRERPGHGPEVSPRTTERSLGLGRRERLPGAPMQRHRLGPGRRHCP